MAATSPVQRRHFPRTGRPVLIRRLPPNLALLTSPSSAPPVAVEHHPSSLATSRSASLAGDFQIRLPRRAEEWLMIIYSDQKRVVLCGACHMLLDHFSHKHKWHSPKVTYNKAFWIRIQARSTVLVAKDWPLVASSQFVASISTLLDPSSKADCHCCGLNQAILRLRCDVNASGNIGIN